MKPKVLIPLLCICVSIASGQNSNKNEQDGKEWSRLADGASPSGSVRIYGTKSALEGFLSKHKQHQQARHKIQHTKHPHTRTTHLEKEAVDKKWAKTKYFKKETTRPHNNQIKHSDYSVSGTSSTAASDKSDTKTSPALSALALMGFLYFLNRMQDVLSGKRRKRSLNEEERAKSYLDSIQHIFEQAEEYFLDDEYMNKVDGVSKLHETNDLSGRSLEGRSYRIVSIISGLLAKIPQKLGLTGKASSRKDGGTSLYSQPPDKASSGFWSLFGERVGLLAKIMDFLDNPEPSRIGRQNHEIYIDEKDPNEEYAIPSDLSPEDKSFLPPRDLRQNIISRTRRFSDDNMNIWYSEAAESRSQDTSEGNERMLSMVFNLFRKAISA